MLNRQKILVYLDIIYIHMLIQRGDQDPGPFSDNIHLVPCRSTVTPTPVPSFLLKNALLPRSWKTC